MSTRGSVWTRSNCFHDPLSFRLACAAGLRLLQVRFSESCQNTSTLVHLAKQLICSVPHSATPKAVGRSTTSGYAFWLTRNGGSRPPQRTGDWSGCPLPMGGCGSIFHSDASHLGRLLFSLPKPLDHLIQEVASGLKRFNTCVAQMIRRARRTKRWAAEERSNFPPDPFGAGRHFRWFSLATGACFSRSFCVGHCSSP